MDLTELKKNPPIHPDELKDFHYKSGITFFATQQFEYAIKFLLFLLAAHKLIPVELAEAEDIMESRRKKTIGQIFTQLKKVVKFDMELETIITNALDTRNKFVHGFLVDNSELLADPMGRKKLTLEMSDFRKIMLKADETIGQIIEQLFDKFGKVSYEQVFSATAEEIRALNKADTEDEQRNMR